MSSLRKLAKTQGTVTLSDGQSFTVSGLSLNSIMSLYSRYPGELATLFDKYANEGVTQENTAPLAQSLLHAAPLLVAQIIALGSGGDPFDDRPIDPEAPEGATVWQGDVALAAELPMPVQLDALQKIGGLTFTPEMPPKKFLSVLVSMMQDARSHLISTSSSED